MATAKKKTSTRRYGRKASEKVGKAVREMKRGELRSGGSGKKVTSRKQAVAIGLSEARREGGKVPEKRKRRPTTTRKGTGATGKKSGGRKRTTTARKRTTGKGSTSRKRAAG
jgi:hypothetical protein